MSFGVLFRPAAHRELLSLPRKVRERILARLEELASDPHMPGTEPLRGDLKGRRKLRTGEYRVVYVVEPDAVVIRAVAVGHRSRVYSTSSRRQGGASG